MMTTQRVITVVPYNPTWPTLFAEEAKKIANALGKNMITIHHIGSTSVPGLAAKPIIDIMPVVKDILAVDNRVGAMAALGYTVKGEYGIPFRRFFSKDNVNVHVFEEGNSDIHRHIKFAEYLKTHPDFLQAYAELKIKNAKDYPNDIVAYCNAKDSLIQEIEENIGLDSPRVVQTCLDAEWEQYHRIYQQQIYEPANEPYDRDDEWFSSPTHFHFVYRLGTKIIGILHIEFVNKQKADILTLALDNEYQTQEHEAYLLNFAEKWLKHQGKTIIK